MRNIHTADLRARRPAITPAGMVTITSTLTATTISIPPRRTFLTKYVFSTDHKVIGIQFLFSGLIFFVLGGLLAMAVRWQLAWPWKPMPILSRLLWSDPSLGYQMPPEFYNKLFTMHATIMIFFVIIPLLTGAFGNFLIPLMIGARDMAFPKLNMFSYWFMPPAMILITYSFFVEGGSAEAGWTSYPILTIARWATPGLAQRPDVLAAGAAVRRHLVAAGVDQLHHDDRHAAGAGHEDVPDADDGLGHVHHGAPPGVRPAGPDLGPDHADCSTAWSGTNFFSPVGWTVANAPPVVGGGGPLLFQHLFWFYSHPAVYVMILPAMGMVSDIIATFSRKPLFGYKPMVFAIAGIAGLGFIVWGHHMFQSGMNPALGATFMLSTMMIALPSAIKVFNWLGTMWGGRLQYTSAMLNAMAFVAMFIIGGLSGIFMAATPVDMHIHDTYFIVGHIHYVLFGGSTFAHLRRRSTTGSPRCSAG